MLLQLHKSIQNLLYERGQISPREVDIRFEAPTRERVEKLIRPTINLFLFDLQENKELRRSDFETTKQNGRAERRALPRRFDLRYMVSALTTSSEDEYLLLWRVLTTLLRHPQLPTEVLSEELRQIELPLVTRVSQDDEGRRMSDLWSALGGQPRPALYYVVTVPVDMELSIEAPLVLRRTTRYTRMRDERTAVESGVQIGGVVRAGSGEPLANVRVALEGSAAFESVTNTEGRFTLRDVRPSTPGTLHLRVTQADGTQKVIAVDVPGKRDGGSSDNEHPYDIVLDAPPS
ncbi:MAG TPA: Pvc16 family protein [Ktedonobacteraceae bacterium]|nr:Pvc16 family protein [Ktedonobacteraceae bacterium]